MQFHISLSFVMDMLLNDWREMNQRLGQEQLQSQILS